MTGSKELLVWCNGAMFYFQFFLKYNSPMIIPRASVTMKTKFLLILGLCQQTLLGDVCYEKAPVDLDVLNCRSGGQYLQSGLRTELVL